MSDDIAVLSIQVDSTSAEPAAERLDALTVSSERAEDATARLSATTTAAQAPLAQRTEGARRSVEALDHASEAADNFQRALRTEAQTLGMSRSQLLQYKADLLGVGQTDFTQKYIQQIKAMEKANADAEASSSGLASRVGGRLQTLGLRAGIHFLVVSMAIMGTIKVWQEYLALDDKIQEFYLHRDQEAAKAAVSVAHVIRSYEEEQKALDKGGMSQDQVARAHERMAGLRDQLLAQGPEYRKALADENMSWQQIRDTIREVNESKLHSIEADIALLESQRKERTELGLWEATKASLKGAIVGMGDVGNAAAATAKLELEASLEKQKKYEDELNKAYKARADIKEAMGAKDASDDREHTKALAQQNDYERERQALEREAVGLMEKGTLEQQRQAALKAEDVRVQQQLQRLTDEGEKRRKTGHGGLTAAQEEQLSFQAIDQSEKKKQEIVEHYNDLRLKAQQDLDEKLAIYEEQGYARRRDAMLRAFDKTVEEAKAKGLDVAAAPDARQQALKAFDDREVTAGVERLMGSLKKLEEEKGRALSFDEQIANIQLLADRLRVDVPGAVDAAIERIKKLQERSKDGWAGAMAGLEDYARKAEDSFGNVKHMAEGWFQGFEDKLTEATMKGKADWRDMIDSMIADLVRLNLQKNVLGPVADWLGKAAASWFGPSGSGGDASGGDLPNYGSGSGTPTFSDTSAPATVPTIAAAPGASPSAAIAAGGPIPAAWVQPLPVQPAAVQPSHAALERAALPQPQIAPLTGVAAAQVPAPQPQERLASGATVVNSNVQVVVNVQGGRATEGDRTEADDNKQAGKLGRLIEKRAADVARQTILEEMRQGGSLQNVRR